MSRIILPGQSEPSDVEVARDMIRVARYGIYNGLAHRDPQMARYVDRCKRVLLSRGCTLLYTRDATMHSMGWWKNPDYERCLHLSISFFDVETLSPAPHDHRRAREWCEIFFDGMTSYIWAEPPFSPGGKKKDVWHYRVFVAPDFRLPIVPRGEVYSRELTEAGWKSWSDLHGGEPVESAHT